MLDDLSLLKTDITNYIKRLPKRREFRYASYLESGKLNPHVYFVSFLAPLFEDGENLSDSEEYVILITDVDEPPEIIFILPEIEEGFFPDANSDIYINIRRGVSNFLQELATQHKFNFRRNSYAVGEDIPLPEIMFRRLYWFNFKNDECLASRGGVGIDGTGDSGSYPREFLPDEIEDLKRVPYLGKLPILRDLTPDDIEFLEKRMAFKRSFTYSVPLPVPV